MLFILNQEFSHEPVYIFTNSLNSLYLINTQIKHPILQNNHPNKTILALIAKMLKDCIAPTTLHKVRAHTNVKSNVEVDKLAKEGSKIDLENNMPIQPHKNTHCTPLWWCRDDDHLYKGPIRHLKTYLEKVEKECNKELAKTFNNISK